MHRLIHLHRRHGEEKKQQSQGPPACPRERSSKGDLTTPSTKLNVLVEAPPIILYGPPASSTGALFSGHLRIAVAELAGEITLNQFEVRVIYKTNTKKPMSNHYQYCTTRTKEFPHRISSPQHR